MKTNNEQFAADMGSMVMDAAAAHKRRIKPETKDGWHIGAGNGKECVFSNNGRMRLKNGKTTLYPVCTMTKGFNPAEDLANARLIAAAPELLALCRRLTKLAEKQVGFVYKAARDWKDCPSPQISRRLAQKTEDVIKQIREVHE